MAQHQARGPPGGGSNLANAGRQIMAGGPMSSGSYYTDQSASQPDASPFGQQKASANEMKKSIEPVVDNATYSIKDDIKHKQVKKYKDINRLAKLN